MPFIYEMQIRFLITTLLDNYSNLLYELGASNWGDMYADMWLMTWSSIGIGKYDPKSPHLIQSTFEDWVKHEGDRPLEHGKCQFSLSWIQYLYFW